MLVRCLSGHSLGGGRDVFPGDEYEEDDALAILKIRQGRVEPVIAAAPEIAVSEPATEKSARGKKASQ